MARRNARNNDRDGSDFLPYGATLPVQRAFVVHFADAGSPGRRRFIGRVEHLSTAEAASFSSLDELLDFFGRLALGRT